MWRSFFLALGITAAIVGAQCLVVDKAVLVQRAPAAPGGPPPLKELVPPEWAPWSLISGGAVVMLYSFTVPRKLQG
ncbi:MAG: hypothetical protein WD468_01510 [Pirellulales bacterium]